MVDIGGRVDLIEKSIQLIGDLDDAQKKRLMEIADKCPVHKTLKNTVIIQSTLQNEVANAN